MEAKEKRGAGSSAMKWTGQGSHMQWLHLPMFRGVTVLKVGHTSENLRRKTNRQKFNHEGNHRLWNQGDSSCLVLPNHSIAGFIFIHQEIKTSTFNNASSASDMPRAPTESSRILVSVRNTTANTRQDTNLASSMVCVYFSALRLKYLPVLRGTSHQVLTLLLKTQHSKNVGNREGDHHGIYYKNNSSPLGTHTIQ